MFLFAIGANDAKKLNPKAPDFENKTTNEARRRPTLPSYCGLSPAPCILHHPALSWQRCGLGGKFAANAHLHAQRSTACVIFGCWRPTLSCLLRSCLLQALWLNGAPGWVAPELERQDGGAPAQVR